MWRVGIFRIPRTFKRRALCKYRCCARVLGDRVIASDLIQHLMTQPYEFTLKLLCSLSHESVIFISASTALAKYTLRDRGALNLLISEQKVKREAGTKTWMIRSREDVASIVSAAAESLVRMLKDFKEKGLITTVKRSIFVEDYNGFLLVSDLRHNAVNQ